MALFPNKSFFLVFLIIHSTSFSYATKLNNATTLNVCEGNVLNLQCKDPDHVIKLLYGNYGRTSKTLCLHPMIKDLHCISAISNKILTSKCHLKKSCSIPASNSVFGDPCVNTYKYIEVQYICEEEESSRKSPQIITTTTLPTPSTENNSVPTKTTTTTTTSTTTIRTTPGNTYVVPQRPSYYEAICEEMQILNVNQYCSPITVRNINWDWTHVDTKDIQPCPGGTEGYAKWACTLRPPPQKPSNHQNHHEFYYYNSIRSLNNDTNDVYDSNINNIDDDSDENELVTTSIWYPTLPDLSECHSNWLTALEKRILKTLNTQRGNTVPLMTLVGDLKQMIASNTLYGGDLSKLTNLIHLLVDKVRLEGSILCGVARLTGISKGNDNCEFYLVRFVDDLLRIASHLFDPVQVQSWHDLEYRAQMKVATTLLKELEGIVALVAERGRPIELNMENMYVSVRVIESPDLKNEVFVPYSKTPPSILTHEYDSDYAYHAQISQATLRDYVTADNYVRIVFMAFDQMDEILYWKRDQCDSPLYKKVLNSKVLSINTLYNNSNRDNNYNNGNNNYINGKRRRISNVRDPVKLTFNHLRTENISEQPLCVLWDYMKNQWSPAGCVLVRTNNTHTTCHCNQLSSYAVFTDVHVDHL